MIESGLLSTKIFFSSGYTKNWSKEIFVIDSGLKTNPWTYNIKDLNEEKGLLPSKRVIIQNQIAILEKNSI